MKEKFNIRKIYIYITILLALIMFSYFLNFNLGYEKFEKYVDSIILDDLVAISENFEKYLDENIGKYFHDEILSEIPSDVDIKTRIGNYNVTLKNIYKDTEIFVFDIGNYPTTIKKIYSSSSRYFTGSINKNEIIQRAMKLGDGYFGYDNYVFSFKIIDNNLIIIRVNKKDILDTQSFLLNNVLNLREALKKYYDSRKYIILSVKDFSDVYVSRNAFKNFKSFNFNKGDFVDIYGIIEKELVDDIPYYKEDKYKIYYYKNDAVGYIFLRVNIITSITDNLTDKLAFYNYVIILFLMIFMVLLVLEISKLENLSKFNSLLEKKINERTLELTVINRYQKHSLKEAQIAKKELSLKNLELIESMKELKKTQNKLIESEKMASLGSLVAGVAHEINTPIGNSVTASSFIETETKNIRKKIENGKISKRELFSYFDEIESSTNILTNSLYRASELISSFKKIAVDQSNDILERFNLKEYLEMVKMSLNYSIKNTNHKILIHGDDIYINSYPGAFAQIFSNLIMNSVIHGLDDVERGIMQIKIMKYEDDKVKIVYTDNGVGIDKYLIKKVFDPFFTTKRGKGGSGLGLNIIYNLVTQTLNGEIELKSEKNKGVEFTIIVPINYNNEDKDDSEILD